ncbi:MAG: hypothetical protein MUE95_13775 [Cyclobacteriaceae bacterium]|nr:hypothetical protein [Cyclobacteriaceae bacterium]
MKNVIIAFLLLLLVPGCTQSARQDFIVDKDQIMDIINNYGGTKKFTIKRSEFKSIQVPKDFYSARVHAYERKGDNKWDPNNEITENVIIQSDNYYIFNIDKMISKDYTIICELELFPPGGNGGATFEIEII